MTIADPLSASPWAMALPIPRLPPVTTATLPARSKEGSACAPSFTRITLCTFCRHPPVDGDDGTVDEGRRGIGEGCDHERDFVRSSITSEGNVPPGEGRLVVVGNQGRQRGVRRPRA